MLRRCRPFLLNPRRMPGLKEELAKETKSLTHIDFQMPETVRYNQRSSAERVNANLEGNHGGHTVRVRGPNKVMCQLMFGILAITVNQIRRLVT